MVIVEVDGKTMVRLLDRRVSAEALEAVVGGIWKIECQARHPMVDGICYVVARATAYTDKLPQNMEASRMCGRMVWGNVAFVRKGSELA